MNRSPQRTNERRREKEAFERLVHEKKHIVMPTDVFESAALAPRPGTYIDKLVADTVGGWLYVLGWRRAGQGRTGRGHALLGFG